jgi:hypothetical protein
VNKPDPVIRFILKLFRFSLSGSRLKPEDIVESETFSFLSPAFRIVNGRKPASKLSL